MSPSSNAWMSNPQYLAQVGHTLGGALLIVGVTLFSIVLGAGWLPTFIALLVGVVVAAFKEFVYDTNAKWGEGDSWSDSLMDFVFYVLGGSVGMAISAVAHRLNHGC